MLKGVIFDWDGTLCDTLPVCVGAFRLTMRHYLGKILSDAEIMEHFGVNEKGIIMLKMPGREAEWDAALEEYDRHYRELHAPLREPYPGIRELLDDLRKKGVKIALITGKAEGSCAISLEMTNLRDAFDFIRTGSEFGLNKKACIEDFIRETGFSREDVYYVGDAPSDVKEAKAAGVHAVSVLWSSIVDEAGVRKEAPEAVFKTVEELKKYLNDQTAAKKTMTEELANNEEKHLDFIRQKINNDLASGKFKRVVTRFPPEPNGYLHIGHAKALCLDFGLAEEYPDAECHLRFDDTNPSKEDDEYVEAIKEDIHWLGFDWGPHLYFASDYFEKMYEWALEMIRKGKAYVDDSTPEEIRQMRGTLTEPGVESPYRNRSVEENLDLFQRMRAGEFPDGSKVLRAKIDMKSQNINFRDPVMYRIVRKEHHRQGSKWCIYPMYDWAHGLEDSIEGITNSLCSLEFENHRPLYNWFLDQLDNIHHPEQTEFARLNLTGTVMSKRKLRTLVDNGYVTGWDDPRMPTLSGMRRRGYPPAAIREFIKRVGIAKVDSVVDFALLEHCVRDELNRTAQRLMMVQDPLKVVLTNYPEGQTETLTAINNPEDESAGTREVPFGRELYIERDDFMEDPPNKFFRLAPGREVRLRYAYFITCQEVIKDAAGNITELRCTYDPATRGGESPDGRKVKGTIHWVAAHSAVKITLNNFSALFKVDDPENVPEGQDFTVNVAEDSLTVNDKALAEPAAADIKPLEPVQFERIGYFTPDRTTTKEAPVYNRTATLKDSWGKIQKKQ